jgi:hypothetical protein
MPTREYRVEFRGPISSYRGIHSHKDVAALAIQTRAAGYARTGLRLIRAKLRTRPGESGYLSR